MILSALILLSIEVPHLLAQRVKSSLTGMVADPSGASIPGAKVVLTNQGTNTSLTFLTRGDGIYTFPFLDPGTFTLTVTATGFKTVVRTRLEVRAATDERVDTVTQVGERAETLTVNGISPLLEAASATIGQTVSEKLIEDLPLNGRNIFGLLNILPGSLGGRIGPAGRQ